MLNNTDFATHVLGLADIAYLDEALAALEMGPLPEAALAELQRLWRGDFRPA